MFLNRCRVFSFETSKSFKLNFLIRALKTVRYFLLWGIFNIFFGQQKFSVSQQHAVDLPLIEIQPQYDFIRNTTVDVLKNVENRDIRNIN